MRIFSNQIVSFGCKPYKPNQVIINGSGTFKLTQDGLYNLYCVGGKGGSCSLSWRQDIISGDTPMDYNSYGTLSGGNGGKFDGWIYLTKGIYTAVVGKTGSYNSAYHVTVSTSVSGGSGTASYLRNSNGTNLVSCSAGTAGSAHVTYDPNDGNYTSKTSVSYGASMGNAGKATISNTAEVYNVTTGNESSPKLILTYLGTKDELFANGIPFTRPNLTSAVSIGGSTFGVEVNTQKSATYAGWRAVDADATSSFWMPNAATATFTFYNPKAINVTKLESVFYSSGYRATFSSIEGSNNGSTWTTITSNNTVSSGTIFTTLTNTNYYKYYKITYTSATSTRMIDLKITATQEAT